MNKSSSHPESRSGNFEQSESLLDSEIPPAIACVVCGLTDCEGCESRQGEEAPVVATIIAWEQAGRARSERLWETTRATVLHADTTFRDLAREAAQENDSATGTPGSVVAAFNYAFTAEFWAVLSWALPWFLGFAALFPRLTWHMISNPSVFALGFVILLFLVLCVVVIHMWWGLTVEWGVSRAGKRASYSAGVRFGLYACGWDLLTSPAGFFVHLLRDGWRGGFESVRSGTQVPRTAMNAYLVDGRGLSEPERRTAMWTAIWITSVGLLLGFGSMLLALIWWMLRDLSL